jgi:tetratricopeptide (TPR) repeat protein
LSNLAVLYDIQGRFDEAVENYRRVIGIWQSTLGPMHPRVADSLQNLASVYCELEKYAEAEPLFKRAIEIRSEYQDRNPHDLAVLLETYAETLRKLGRTDEAAHCEGQAADLREIIPS